MRRISEERQRKIIELRKFGKSIPEIVKETGFAQTTVTRYVAGIHIAPEYLQLLKEKQGGSKSRAHGLRENIFTTVRSKLGNISDRDCLFLLIGLYWGEGTKKDFGIINSDPQLIQAFLSSLQVLNIGPERLSISLRVHADISIPHAKKFWALTTGLPEQAIGRIEIIEGKKKGKLPHGMCRVRIRSGIRERLYIQSAIEIIGKESNEKVVSTMFS